MRRLEHVLKNQFKLSVRKKLKAMEIVEYLIPEFGIILHDENTLMSAAASNNYTLVPVDVERLDDQMYVGSITREILHALIRSGYLRKIRLTNAALHKSLVLGHKCGLFVIEERLKLMEGLPKNSYAIKENEEVKKNLDMTYMRNPEFFDFI